MGNFTYIAQMSRVRAVVTPHLPSKVPFPSFAEGKLFLFFSALYDQNAFSFINVLVYTPESRAFLQLFGTIELVPIDVCIGDAHSFYAL